MQSDNPDFNRKYEELSAPVLHYAYTLCRDWAWAEDVSQQLWIRMYRYHKKHSSFPEIGNVYNMTKQAFIDDYRKQKRRDHVCTMEDPPEIPMMPVRQDSLFSEDESGLFNQFWEQFTPLELPLIDRQVFWLHERYGYTMIEIAEKTQLAKSTAHDKLKKVKAACLDFLNQEESQ